MLCDSVRSTYLALHVGLHACDHPITHFADHPLRRSKPCRHGRAPLTDPKNQLKADGTDAEVVTSEGPWLLRKSFIPETENTSTNSIQRSPSPRTCTSLKPSGPQVRLLELRDPRGSQEGPGETPRSRTPEAFARELGTTKFLGGGGFSSGCGFW